MATILVPDSKQNGRTKRSIHFRMRLSSPTDNSPFLWRHSAGSTPGPPIASRRARLRSRETRPAHVPDRPHNPAARRLAAAPTTSLVILRVVHCVRTNSADGPTIPKVCQARPNSTVRPGSILRQTGPWVANQLGSHGRRAVHPAVGGCLGAHAHNSLAEWADGRSKTGPWYSRGSDRPHATTQATAHAKTPPRR